MARSSAIALIVGPAGIRAAQEAHLPFGNIDDDQVLVAVRLFLPAVVRGLFLGVFGPLATAVGAVNDEPGRSRPARLA